MAVPSFMSKGELAFFTIVCIAALGIGVLSVIANVPMGMVLGLGAGAYGLTTIVLWCRDEKKGQL